jgi:hypothetical protein
VRDSEKAAAGLLFVGRHPLPEVARVVAAEWGHCRVGHNSVRHITAVAEYDVAVEVVAPRIRRPLIPDESSEPAGIIGLLGRVPGDGVGGR